MSFNDLSKAQQPEKKAADTKETKPQDQQAKPAADPVKK